jgi:hypothetical protein
VVVDSRLIASGLGEREGAVSGPDLSDSNHLPMSPVAPCVAVETRGRSPLADSSAGQTRPSGRGTRCTSGASERAVGGICAREKGLCA